MVQLTFIARVLDGLVLAASMDESQVCIHLCIFSVCTGGGGSAIMCGHGCAECVSL
jgi:hypothetical protein